MRFFTQLSTIHVMFWSWSWSYSLVTIHMDQRILVKYYRHVQLHPDGAPRITLSDRKLLVYCHKLRQSRVFQMVDSGGPWDSRIPPMVFRVPASAMKIENDSIGLRSSTDFRLDNTTQIVNQQSFQCYDLQGNMKWFITPAFIPTSTFLYVVQPSFEYLSSRQTKTIVNIPARLEAIIDASATDLKSSVPAMRDIIQNSISQSPDPTRDRLCNQNRIIQYRICAIAADAVDEFLKIKERNRFAMYENRNRNQYYWTQDPEENCRPMSPTLRKYLNLTSTAKHRKMLHCLVNIQEYERATTFYLNLNHMLPTNVVYLQESFDPQLNDTAYIIQHLSIPLLYYLNEYEEALKNLTF